MCVYQSDRFVNGIKWEYRNINGIIEYDKDKKNRMHMYHLCDIDFIKSAGPAISVSIGCKMHAEFSNIACLQRRRRQQNVKQLSQFTTIGRNIESFDRFEHQNVESICENHPIDCCWLKIDIDFSAAKSITLIALQDIFTVQTLSLRLLCFALL